MIQPRESQAAQPGLQIVKPEMDAVVQADSLLERALEGLAELTALLESLPLESEYGVAFAAQVEAKHDQTERIEDRLEKLIEQQASRLQETQASQPGFFLRPGARNKWQGQVQQQQSAIQRLHGRLEAVREIKEGMGVHGPRIEELAHRKVRAHEPDLANKWEAMGEAQRLHQVMLRKQEKEKKQAVEREQRGEHSGRSLRLGWTQAR